MPKSSIATSTPSALSACIKLARRYVHTHAQAGSAIGIPVRGLATGLDQGPGADLLAHRGFLEHGQEQVGHQQAQFGMVPAQQGLGGGGMAIVEGYDRLVVHL